MQHIKKGTFTTNYDSTILYMWEDALYKTQQEDKSVKFNNK